MAPQGFGPRYEQGTPGENRALQADLWRALLNGAMDQVTLGAGCSSHSGCPSLTLGASAADLAPTPPEPDARDPQHREHRLIGPEGIEEDLRMQARFSANTAQALRKAAVAGLGIAMLPVSLARMELNAGRVVRVLPQYTCEGHGLNILYPSRRHLPLAVSAFIALATEKLSDLESTPLSDD